MPSQSDLYYSFQPLASRSAFEVLSFKLKESLSSNFQLELELISHECEVDFGQILDKPALFTISRANRPLRHVHGLVSIFNQGDSGPHRTRYSALIEPQLARANLCSNWRIFQQKTVPQILELILVRQGISQYQITKGLDHHVREFCVQAGETDFDFFARLLAEEGFVYRFEHTEKSHTLVISDRLLTFGNIPGDPSPTHHEDEGLAKDEEPAKPFSVLYRSNSAGAQATPCLRRLRYSEKVRTARQVQRDYTFTNPAYRQEHRATGRHLEHQSCAYERFDYPGRYKRDAVGKPFTENRISALRHDVRVAEVQGDDVRLQPGLSFTLAGHPRADLNVHWRVIAVTHEGSQFTSLQEEAAGVEQSTRYDQVAQLVPGKAEWRPAPLARPRVDGPHMATVVGPPGEEIYCDEWGRVKVSFPWDRESQDNEFSSCWVRVSQGWAGGSWGSMAIPRIGQDVIIHYVNGDPDQPMITGRTYCGDQLPPYDLPQHKTRMTIKSQTHKGDGFNELRFEDELGQEEVFIHAQKDQNIVVRHDETTQVGNDRKEQVNHDESILIGHDRTETVGNDERVSIGHDATLDIGRNQTIRVAKDRIETIGNHRHDQITANHHARIGGNLEQQVEGHAEFEARGEIRRRTRRYELRTAEAVIIQGPGGSIRIDEAGITLDSPTIRINGQVLQSPDGAGNLFSLSGAPTTGTPLDRQCGRRPDGTCPLPDCRCLKGPGR
ncbi:type VI secretion system tip protein VgrG [Pseudomonas sp. AFG_SD02_1510_Pfu_092]|uniref:type VI secretion system Vgr family protein n=1 Tax=Pseudomonas sp. AFG_SD02_1510_Pfu_092 TaxID=2259497 RepID=UPI000DEFE8AB|nr:type VI secretion system tip protein TssI/VgrG [Pseudomonas sp. AFG_SD02_1510_Pfu_092]RCL28431.1 type VI secretion system tip protein VgrG [Pseudomonas sp. AFG_SD02_1510_Pfu_092]